MAAARLCTAANIAGGLHHAMRRSASGFCVYNDPAIAIAWLLAAGAQPGRLRGPRRAPRRRRAGRLLRRSPGADDQPARASRPPCSRAPGWRRRSAAATAAATRSTWRCPAGTGDAGWLRAFDAVVPPLLRAFRPEVLVSQHGCDSHRLDPLAHLELSIDAQRRAALMVHDLAHETAAAGGCSPAAADTSWSRSCRDRGPTCWRWRRAARSTRPWPSRPAGGPWPPTGRARTRPR